MTTAKAASTLTLEDALAHPVWRYKEEEALLPGEDESWVEPVDVDTVADAYGHFFVTSAKLANGTSETVLVGSTEPLDPQYNEQVQFFVFFRPGQQIRWHPIEQPGVALAQFLGLEPQHVFPFKFDIRRYLVGDPSALERAVWARGIPSEA
jgi:hypothetical protein